jgi:hypothetical protein
LPRSCREGWRLIACAVSRLGYRINYWILENEIYALDENNEPLVALTLTGWFWYMVLVVVNLDASEVDMTERFIRDRILIEGKRVVLFLKSHTRSQAIVGIGITVGGLPVQRLTPQSIVSGQKRYQFCSRAVRRYNLPLKSTEVDPNGSV